MVKTVLHSVPPLEGRGFPTPTGNSLTSAGGPTILLNSDTLYLELASDPTD